MITISADQTELKLSGSEEAKKPFAEPEISGPVDVLEATWFFQILIGSNDAADITG